MEDHFPDIKTLIPQGPPFIMVDRLLGSDDSATRTSFLVIADNLLTLDGKFSMAGLIENMAQTAAAGAGYAAWAAGGGEGEGPARGGAIVAINNLLITRLPELGEELITEVTITARVAEIVVISGRITCGQSVVATGEMKILTGI
jgi:predicted hotdog family 3-hydroxylacyl-ACP dehydratase